MHELRKKMPQTHTLDCDSLDNLLWDEWTVKALSRDI